MTDTRGLKDVCVVTGVVAPSSPSGARIGSNEEWSLHLTLDMWHREDRLAVSTPLRIRRDVGQAELESLLSRLHACELVSVRVRFEEPDSAQLIEILKAPHDPSEDLTRHAADLIEPMTFIDGQFGTFTLDRRLDWYQGSALWGGRTVSLNLNAAQEPELSAAIRNASTLWEQQSAWSRRLEDCALTHLLTLKNDCWLDDDEQSLGPEEFRARLRLESVTVEPDGEFEFWYNDGNLFLGHSVRVDGNLTDGATHASIRGERAPPPNKALQLTKVRWADGMPIGALSSRMRRP